MSYLLIVLSLGWLLFWFFEGKKRGKTEQRHIEFLLDNTGHIVQMRLSPEDRKDLDQKQAILEEAKNFFKEITTLFVSGDTERLKDFVSKAFWEILRRDIEERQRQNQTLEFQVVNFISVSMLSYTPGKEMKVVYVSEQYNVLRDAQQHVLEGKDNQIIRMKDVWTFQKEGKKWCLMMTESEPVHV